MKKFIKLFLYSSMFFFLAENAFAQQGCENVKTTKIYFGNGVGNTLAQARLSRNALGYAYLIKHDIRADYPNEKFNLLLAYNPTRGAIKDILEVFNQKVEETGGLTATEMLNFLQLSKDVAKIAIEELSTGSGAGRVVVQVALEALDVASDVYIESLKNDAEGIGKKFLEATNNNFVQLYNSDIDEGNRVVIIAHSQGNLFANYAVKNVIARNSGFKNNIGIVGVANPAGEVVYNNNYVTANDDNVINALRVSHTVLDSNINNDPGWFNDHRDWLNHGFLESYLASELVSDYALGDTTLLSRARIDNMFFDLLATRQYPEAQLGNGAIKITLEWGAEPDVDLHVFEPNGAHVYYSNMQGNSGTLDLDDTDSFGPEHYFVPCDKLEEGLYRIGVNYFSGEQAETARIQITTSDGRTISFSKNLFTEMGAEGDGTPIPVADINVYVGDDGNYHYSVTAK